MNVIAPFFSAAFDGAISGPLTGGTVITITETGNYQWLTTTGSSNSAASILGANFAFESGAAVPEPTTMLLLGFGLFGVGLGRKFKK